MLFRVTFSNDTDEYYKENPKDIRLSLTLDAKSFKAAELQANQTLTMLLFWPGPYEVVSINRIDMPEESRSTELFNSFASTEVEESNRYIDDYNNGCRCEDCLTEVEPISVQTTGTWNQFTNVYTPEEEVEHVHIWKVYNGFYVCANKCGKRIPYELFNEEWKDYDITKFFESVPEEPVKKAPEIWCLDTGIQIVDPDGWDRKNYKESWYTPITRGDFIKRAMMSTCYRWPEPLLDDQEDETPTCDCHW